MNARNNNGDTPFHYACQEEIVQIFIDNALAKNIEVNALNAEGKAPIVPMFRYGENKGLKLLIKHARALNVDLNTQDHNGLTPLHHACKDYRVDVLRAFVYDPQFGDVDFTRTDRFGRTPLHYACMGNLIPCQYHCVRILLEGLCYDVNLMNTLDDDGNTPLDHLMRFNYPGKKTVKLFKIFMK